MKNDARCGLLILAGELGDHFVSIMRHDSLETQTLQKFSDVNKYLKRLKGFYRKIKAKKNPETV